MREETAYKTFTEYKEYPNTFPKELTDLLQTKGICSLRGNMITFKVTGLLIYRETLLIIFPKAYKLPEDLAAEKEHIEVLFKVLMKYKDEAALDTDEAELLDGENGEYKGNLITIYRLIQDFFQNGYLIKEMRVKTVNYSGRTDWPSTIRKKQPVFSGGSVIYVDHISHKTTVDKQNLLLRLHKYCIYKGIEKYGWLFGVSPDIVEPQKNALNNYDLDSIINFLTGELNNTFVEREIQVIKLLIQFLYGINPEKSEDRLETLATPYFQNVWETMCSVNFNNQYHRLKNVIPKLKWQIDSKASVRPQRPDLMVIKEDTLYILDAKYYDTDRNLPGWGDIVKQLFYAVTIRKKIESESLRLAGFDVSSITGTFNAFLFPSGNPEAIKYIGKVEVDQNELLGEVKAFKVNTFLTMKCYVGKEKFSYINTLIQLSKSIMKN